MSTEKHTPTEWKAIDRGAEGWMVVAENGFTKVCQIPTESYRGASTLKADAALIAAAPELLEALKAHQKANTASEMHAAYFLSRAAIAKAEGR